MNLEAAGVDWLKSSGRCGVPANPLLDAAAVFSAESILSSATTSPLKTMSRCCFKLCGCEELLMRCLKTLMQGACTEPRCRTFCVPETLVCKLFIPQGGRWAKQMCSRSHAMTYRRSSATSFRNTDHMTVALWLM